MSDTETSELQERKRTMSDESSRHDEAGISYPKGIKLALIMTSAYLSMFLVALDRLIISTAIPRITDEFHSVTNVGWYGSAYLLTNCAFQLMFGKLYMFYSVRWVFLASIFLFEVGSAVCGAAPNSTALIVGRAIAGLGSAGIYSGSVITLVYSVPLSRRAPYQAVFSAVFGLASVIAPLIGGALTDSSATWRWCFYLNLPIGAVAAVFIFMLLRIPVREANGLTARQKLAQLDAPGSVALLGGVICLLLALKWGGAEYNWSNGKVIALLTLGLFLLGVFVVIQILLPNTATVPKRVFAQRTVMAASFSMFCSGSTMLTTLYYLPIWFQGIEGVDAVESGIRLLPTVIAQVISAMAGGILIQKSGQYMPILLISTAIMSVGTGLITTLHVNSTEGQWIGYQIPYGFGLGPTLQVPLIAAQTVLPLADVPIGTSVLLFCQLLGACIFVSVGQSLLDNSLVKQLTGVDGIDLQDILDSGATQLAKYSAATNAIVLKAYNHALRDVFICGLVLSCMSFLGSAFMEWRSIKPSKPKTEPSEGEKGAPPLELQDNL